ncbi:MAG: hypothetical protein LKH27_11435 [Prevotella sp.]|jgi:hypothetical protein|nr:hypothetical protein [Prevotella sp.]MCH3992917.1 hypothetical protein [Prevotella sp.]MCI1475003.1 hypothetical protein [Prevotella sp.]MCI1548846.1 hypothetical protein [Prevotella sp.]
MKNNQLSTQIRFYHDSGKSFLADLCQFLQKTIFLLTFVCRNNSSYLSTLAASSGRDIALALA